ncbi:Leucine-rich PPR motif-containing protein, mitochondrial [Ooceraea biroi]|uniref:Leucine-rich PPR motif-containing protein, mitochondrial n=2 Tax=Ooceraea biroi TaxID=2015173 RepID=A0A026VYQ0_OOCBI|nr:Leucine-rich PPR motif-containing protein, mitochondrial [Ooceraea biroi]
METEKVLHLRRYVTLLQTGVRSRIVRSHLHTYGTNSPRGGYVVHCVPKQSLQVPLRSENYVSTYARMFSTTVAQSSVEDIDQKLMLLCNDSIKKGQVSVDDLQEILKLCDCQLRPSTSLLLLKCCGSLSPDLNKSKKQQLLDQVWNLAQKNSKEDLTLDHYNTLLQIQMESSTFINPMQFLAGMTVEPDENTYSLLLNVAAKTGNSRYLWDVMSMIKEKNILFDENTFNVLVQIYINNSNMAEAEHMVMLMRDTKLSTAKAYTELACGYARLGNIPSLIKILNDEPQSDTNLLRITKVLGSSDNSRHIPVVLNFLTAPISANEPEISKTIAELTRTNQITGALTIIKFFSLNSTMKDVMRNFINSFLNELIIIKAPKTDITKYAVDFMGYEPLALSNVAETALKLGREDLCYAIFDAMREKGMEIRPHYYWPLLVMAHYNTGEAKIFAILQSMKDADVEVDFDTLCNYVYPYINTANPRITLHRMVAMNLPNAIIFLPLLAFLLSRNQLRDVIDLCENSQHKISYKELMRPLVGAYFDTRDVQNCVKLLTIRPNGQAFISMFFRILLSTNKSKFDVNDLQLFMKEFAKRNAKISRQDANFLRKRFLNNFTDLLKNTNVLELLESLVDEQIVESVLSIPVSPKYMNTKDLECFLVEQKYKKLYTANTLSKLIDLYCNENKLKKAEEMKREIEACGYKTTNKIMLNLLELYIKNNKLDEAKAIISSINNTFPIDSAKILMYANALVKVNKITKAFDIIEEITNVNNSINTQKFCFTLLDTLAQSQYHDQTKNMLRLLVQKKYCVLTVEMLRPLIAIPLRHNNIMQAMDTFKACAQKYKKAPLALELLTALLQQRNSFHQADEYINQVYTILADFHNIRTANTTLLLALATLNKTEEMRSILQKERLSISTLVYYTNYIQKFGKMNPLLRIFEEMPDTSNAEQLLLCDLLINSYNRNGDHNAALDLWNKMCAKNIKFSEQSERSFIQLLLLNNVPLPSYFAKNNNVSNQRSTY